MLNPFSIKEPMRFPTPPKLHLRYFLYCGHQVARAAPALHKQRGRSGDLSQYLPSITTCKIVNGLLPAVLAAVPNYRELPTCMGESTESVLRTKNPTRLKCGYRSAPAGELLVLFLYCNHSYLNLVQVSFLPSNPKPGV